VRALARAAALAAGLLLAGCSATRIIYHNADLYLRWQARSYLALQGEQGAELDRRIAALLAWHRAQALPQYAQFTEEAARRVERGLGRADLVWGYDAFQVQLREALRAAGAEMAGLLDRLAPAQLAHLEERLAEENRQFAREQGAGSPRQERAARLKRSLERLEEWFGALNEEQIERVKRFNQRAPLLYELRDRDRRRRQAEFLAMLRAREGARRLPDWAAAWDAGRAPGYEAAVQRYREEYEAMLLELDRSLTAGQRRAAAARLREWAADFATLARR